MKKKITATQQIKIDAVQKEKVTSVEVQAQIRLFVSTHQNLLKRLRDV
jgi:hypothetical protein